MIFSERVDNFFLRYLTECLALLPFCVCMFSLCLHWFSLSTRQTSAIQRLKKHSLSIENIKFLVITENSGNLQNHSVSLFGFCWGSSGEFTFMNHHQEATLLCWLTRFFLALNTTAEVYFQWIICVPFSYKCANKHTQTRTGVGKRRLFYANHRLFPSLFLSPQATHNKQSHFFLFAPFFSLSLSCPLFSLLFLPSLSPSPVSTSPSLPSLSFHLLRLFLFIAFYCTYPLHRRGEWISKLILDSCSGWWATLRIWIGNTASDLG